MEHSTEQSAETSDKQDGLEQSTVNDRYDIVCCDFICGQTIILVLRTLLH